MYWFSCAIALLCYLQSVACLECYTCSATTADTLCETDPSNVVSGSAIIDCKKGSKQCCMIQRLESNSKLGRVHSLFRGCQSNCSMDSFASQTGPSYTAFYTYCSDPLCNGEVGNKPLGMKDSEVYSTIDNLEASTQPPLTTVSSAMKTYAVTSFCLISLLLSSLNS